MFPVIDIYYNTNFIVFYLIESIVLIFWGHATLAFDIILISMCLAITYRLKAIKSAYTAYISTQNHMQCKCIEDENYGSTINDFKILIDDHQRVIKRVGNNRLYFVDTKYYADFDWIVLVFRIILMVCRQHRHYIKNILWE